MVAVSSEANVVRSLAVEDPQIDEVLDADHGVYVRSVDAIGTDRSAALQLRLDVRARLGSNPRYRCAMCQTPVHLVATLDGQRFHFRHELEDGRCEARTRDGLTYDRIAALKYQGLQESEPHKRMKRWLQDCLAADESFTDIAAEATWRSIDGQSWRRPDVRAVRSGLPVAFEIQLSTTFLKVIAERRNFYQAEGGLLLWVFARFDEGPRRLTQDDVFFNNNQNAFVITPETVRLSVERKALHLECVWTEPRYDGQPQTLSRRVVAFKDLTLEPHRQRAFFFDYEGNKEALDASVRLAFESFWVATDDISADVRDKRWRQLRRDLVRRGVDTPQYPGMLPVPLLNGLYSAKLGRCANWRFSSFIEVAHRMAAHPQYLKYFREALAVYDRAGLIREQDRTGRWRAKVAGYKDALERGDPAYEPDRTYERLVSFLFPELNLGRVLGRRYVVPKKVEQQS